MWYTSKCMLFSYIVFSFPSSFLPLASLVDCQAIDIKGIANIPYCLETIAFLMSFLIILKSTLLQFQSNYHVQ